MQSKYFILQLIFLFCFNIVFSQVNNVTSVEKINNMFELKIGKDKIEIEVCRENIIRMNYLPDGIIYPYTPVISKTSWEKVNTRYSLEGDTIVIGTDKMLIKISKKLFGFTVYNDNKKILNSLKGKGITTNSIDMEVSGKNFYGVSNRVSGNLTTNEGDTIKAGEQGHAGAPFIWTTNGYGILFDSDGGKIILKDNDLSFIKSDQNIKGSSFYIISGSPKVIFTALTDITGKPPLFPKWSLGFMNSEWGIDQKELLKHIRTYREKDIPIDAFILDFDWMDWGNDIYGEFRWGPKFPDANNGNLKKILDSMGIKLLGIRKPRIHLGTIQGNYAESNKFFIGYETDYFSKKKVGLLDFYKPEVRRWYWDSFIDQGKSNQNGIIGYWNDEADAYGGNFMFMNMQKAQYEGQRTINNNRVFSLNRNFYLGNQRYAYGLWSGDIDTGFAVMAQQRLFMLSSVNLGVSWWSMDIGGFGRNPSVESYSRWIQFGAFVPIYRVHASYNDQRQPWFYGKESESTAKKYIRLRYELLPYIYSSAWENHKTGVAISRPLIFDFPDDPNVSNLFSEFLFGDEILVSPIVTNNKNEKLKMYLPKGDWIDFWTGEKYRGPFYLDFTAAQKDIPIFIKAGAIIPTHQVGRYTEDTLTSGTLIINCYSGTEGSFTLYDDDGVTYDYEKGKYSITKLYQVRNNNAIDFSISKSEGDFKTNYKSILIKFYQCPFYPSKISLNNKLILEISPEEVKDKFGWLYDIDNNICIVRIPFDGQEKKLFVLF